MLTVVVISLVVPSLVAAAGLALTGKLPNLVADARGIALQTVIIMVVLLAIAGGVAAVLLNRGGEAVQDIERQDITRDAGDFSGDSLCLGSRIQLEHCRYGLQGQVAGRPAHESPVSRRR